MSSNGAAKAQVRRRGLMLVLSSPSGAGKTTISRALLERDPNIIMSISVTTRPRRPGEFDGKDYIFVSGEEFKALVDRGELLEHAVVFDHCYGTPRCRVEEALAVGRDVLFDIDWQGTQQLSESYSSEQDDLISVFILPPNTQELEARLRQRAQDPNDVVRSRMALAAEEMSHYPEYQYIVINENFETSVEAVAAILAAARLRRERQIGLHEFVQGMRKGGD